MLLKSTSLSNSKRGINGTQANRVDPQALLQSLNGQSPMIKLYRIPLWPNPLKAGRRVYYLKIFVQRSLSVWPAAGMPVGSGISIQKGIDPVHTGDEFFLEAWLDYFPLNLHISTVIFRMKMHRLNRYPAWGFLSRNEQCRSPWLDITRRQDA
jgi:hypothetical protein